MLIIDTRQFLQICPRIFATDVGQGQGAFALKFAQIAPAGEVVEPDSGRTIQRLGRAAVLQVLKYKHHVLMLLVPVFENKFA